jgi:hypothetical protein
MGYGLGGRPIEGRRVEGWGGGWEWAGGNAWASR